jgi:hypothetical protein
MDEPVISTRGIVWSRVAAGVSCAIAECAARPAPSTKLPENIRRTERDKIVSLNIASSFIFAVRRLLRGGLKVPRNREEKRNIAFCLQVARCHQNMGNGQCQKCFMGNRLKTTFSPKKSDVSTHMHVLA